MQLKYPCDTLFEWILYNEFINVKEVGSDCLNTATWKDDITDEVINKIESYLHGYGVQSYGISQNPDIKNYILVFSQDYLKEYCKKCGNNYGIRLDKWCKPCHIKNNFTNRTSRNDKIDGLIQEMRLKINKPDDTIFEWIPYNELSMLKK
ncbi:unnamed protein product [Rhizophagus irregularis]|nr:unnamed protein product [Rhizophagus irregularis]